MSDYAPRHSLPAAEVFPAPAVDSPPVQPRRRDRRPVYAALAVLIVALAATWWFVGPNERNCERQIDSYLVKMLASKTPMSEQPDPNSSQFWQCWGLSDGAKRRAASGAFSKHIGEMMGRAFSEAFTDSFGATTP
ncbi:MAG TPA: hypothetical protein PKV97_17430 [Thauera aminoaromatica]|nr:hypothetical protein [Thauera aminoaromatica]